MAENDIFERASRLQLRFESPRGGALMVEDLWKMPLVWLDPIAISLHRELRDEKDITSFIDDAPIGNPGKQLAFDVIKRIIDVRKAENKAQLEAQERAKTKQKLLGILARKQDNELEGMTAGEIEAKIAAL